MLFVVENQQADVAPAPQPPLPVVETEATKLGMPDATSQSIDVPPAVGETPVAAKTEQAEAGPAYLP